MKIKWQNISPRDLGDPPKDTRHSIRGDRLTLHVYRQEPAGRQGYWMMHVYNGSDMSTILDANTSREAKIEAIEKMQLELDKMLADLNQFKQAPP